jgi:hypothetical protein
MGGRKKGGEVAVVSEEQEAGGWRGQTEGPTQRAEQIHRLAWGYGGGRVVVQ